jgi:hypothetical protein
MVRTKYCIGALTILPALSQVCNHADLHGAELASAPICIGIVKGSGLSVPPFVKIAGREKSQATIFDLFRLTCPAPHVPSPPSGISEKRHS